MSLYTALLAAGVPLDHHESDLYVKVTVESTRIVENQHKRMPRLFTSHIDGELWYDIPFAYEPFWEAVSARSRREP